jgi:hypothetical protein
VFDGGIITECEAGLPVFSAESIAYHRRDFPAMTTRGEVAHCGLWSELKTLHIVEVDQVAHPLIEGQIGVTPSIHSSEQ